ncbi:hypothetical protein [Chondrinema litorale]|uniref:hypothetical protein n=1 Tax=Chondrinema litorale TaxID=2994555 RepID=UPI0025428C29|nr:hypothetical protein [Chondrinema litorale]UZS00250.1 hypothetical protein OQ292_40630 [Chondrinema litorale]
MNSEISNIYRAIEAKANNETISFTRRYPKLRQKVLRRDSEIAKKIIKAWDIERDQNKVFEIFLNKRNNLSDYRYWELLRSVWVICGSVARQDIFRHLFTTNRKHKHYFSTPEEHERFKNLPEQFEVWRGTNTENDTAFAWSLSKEVAEWHKEAYQRKFLISKTVNKSQCFALIERNKEEEILIIN